MNKVDEYMTLFVWQDYSLSSVDHLPLLAGFASDGTALFIATSPGPRISTKTIHAVADGTHLNDLRCRTHYVDGSMKDEDMFPQKYGNMDVFCLRYDLFVYENADDTSPSSVGMDATGPYSWKFNRKLPADRSEDDKRYRRSNHELWHEIIHEPKLKAHIQEAANDHVPSDSALVAREMIQEDSDNVPSGEPEQAAYIEELNDDDVLRDTTSAPQEVTQEANGLSGGPLPDSVAHKQELTDDGVPVNTTCIIGSDTRGLCTNWRIKTGGAYTRARRGRPPH